VKKEEGIVSIGVLSEMTHDEFDNYLFDIWTDRCNGIGHDVVLHAM